MRGGLSSGGKVDQPWTVEFGLANSCLFKEVSRLQTPNDVFSKVVNEHWPTIVSNPEG